MEKMTDFVIKLAEKIPFVSRYMKENSESCQFLLNWNKTYNEPPQGYDQFNEGLMLTMPKTIANLSQWRYDRHKNSALNLYRVQILEKHLR
jgi:hypothetical protein